ncbi:MAG TPA: response regulator [Flavisolibacter sp.]|nr:response regulator [Flavisolibacter sp.]
MQVKYILIVDDDPDDSEFFAAVMRQLDADVHVKVAISKEELFKELEGEVPDLLFIDSFIQQDSGQESIREIRANPRFVSLPIIMYTGASGAKSIKDAFDAGASAYIVKPHTMTEIKTVLQNILQRNWNLRLPFTKQYYNENRFHDYKE